VFPINKRFKFVQACHGGGFLDPNLNLLIGMTPNWKNRLGTDEYTRDAYLKIKNKTAIIPWFNKEELELEYEFRENGPEIPTFLYLARCLECKGLLHFLNFANYFESKPYKFIISGGCIKHRIIKGRSVLETENHSIFLDKFPNITYTGPVGREERKKLLCTVTALIQPTPYFEPCGLNALEAMISGTPAIVPYFGGFVDTVVHGVSGYLTLPYSWEENIEKSLTLSRTTCREYALQAFSEKRAYEEYMLAFETILDP
jgi:glycosyltransferase involved in cell wall biosynthesis